MQNHIKNLVNQRIKGISEVRKYTCQLIKNISNYKGDGTGIFIKIDNLYLLISAAHVFDNFEELFIILDNGKYIFKPGGEIIKNLPKSTRDSDDLDIGILILDDESVEEIKTNFEFLNQSNIQINHQIDYSKNYLVFGYPSSWSKKSMSRNSFHSRAFIGFTNSITVNEYKKFGRQSFLNIILNYDRESTINIKSKSISYGPSLHGISGCGLWHLNSLNPNNNPVLVGIMTDWPISNRKRIIATRIDAVTELLINRYKINFPRTDLFKYK